MSRRHRVAAVLSAVALAWCPCSVSEAFAMGGAMGSATGMGAGASPQSSFSPLRGDAEKIKEEAIILHRAGEYEAAAREFSRAAELLERATMGGESTSASSLNAVRLSLAAAQLKSGDLQGAEATCSQLLKTPGLARALRQKASYRRALARKRQAVQQGSEQLESTSGLARKAYRDAYLAVKLSQGEAGANPAEGDAQAVGLLAEMEDDTWAHGQLSDADRVAAKTKADKHLAALASISATVSPGNSSGEMFDMFAGDSGGLGSLGGAGMGGFPGLGGGSGPGLMDMLGTGAGEGGRGGVGSLMNMLMGGAGGTGGAGGRGAGAGMDKKQMLKTAKKMSKVVKKQLRNPGTQQFVCSFLKKAEPGTIKSLAEAAGVPVGDEIVSRVSTYLKKADGKMLESWIDWGEIASGVYRRVSQLSVILSRGTALAGLWLVWVWIKACFAPVVLNKAKA